MRRKHGKIRSAAVKISRTLLELAYPSDIYCICCGKPIRPGEPYSICPDCMQSIRWANGRTCEKCGKILQDWYKADRCLDCVRVEHRFAKGFSCVQYAEMERALVHDLKYGNKGYLARKMADIMADRIMLEDICLDLIVPVPMHKAKQSRRGYNQAALMAEALSGRISVPWKRNILCRVRDTEPMSGLSRTERMTNLEGAFAASRNAEKHIEGRTLLLIDDVFTTGNTADACTAILLGNGAACVYLMAFAAGANERQD